MAWSPRRTRTMPACAAARRARRTYSADSPDRSPGHGRRAVRRSASRRGGRRVRRAGTTAPARGHRAPRGRPPPAGPPGHPSSGPPGSRAPRRPSCAVRRAPARCRARDRRSRSSPGSGSAPRRPARPDGPSRPPPPAGRDACAGLPGASPAMPPGCVPGRRAEPRPRRPASRPAAAAPATRTSSPRPVLRLRPLPRPLSRLLPRRLPRPLLLPLLRALPAASLAAHPDLLDGRRFSPPRTPAPTASGPPRPANARGPRRPRTRCRIGSRTRRRAR